MTTLYTARRFRTLDDARPEATGMLFASDAAAASMQPLHCTCFNHADRSDNWSRRLGDERVEHGFR